MKVIGLMQLPLDNAERDGFTSLFGSAGETAVDDATWVWEQLDRCSYKPGWSLYAGLDGMVQKPYVMATFDAPDARGGNKSVNVGSRSNPPDDVVKSRSESGFMIWLHQFLLNMEQHELQEWLRRDGKLWNDPHVRFRFPAPPPRDPASRWEVLGDYGADKECSA